MGMLKKLCITTALGIMVAGVSYAARNRNLNIGKEMAELLFDFGDPKLEHVNNEGKSALEIVTDLNNEEFVKFLLTKM